MAYDIQNPPSLITQGIGGGVALRRYEWVGTDTVDAVTAPGYVENAEALGIQLGDIVLYKALDGDTFTAHALIVDDVDPDGRVTLGLADPFSVKGPSNATENNFAVFDGEKGNLIKDAGVGASDFALASVPRAQAMAKAIPAGVTSIQTNGYATAGDGGAALYKRAGSEPAHDLKFQSADGAWWEATAALVTKSSAGGDTAAAKAFAIARSGLYLDDGGDWQAGRLWAKEFMIPDSAFANGARLGSDGHANWARLQSGQNYNPIELVLYGAQGQGFASCVIGGNTITRIIGTGYTSAWLGKEFFYFNGVRYRVASVIDANTLTVQAVGGGAVAFPASVTRATYHYVVTSGDGICDVNGTAVTRKSGQPFIPFGTLITVNGVANTYTFIDEDHVTLGSSGGVQSGVAYRYETNINNQVSTIRVQKYVGGDEENLTIAASALGYYYINSQIARDGFYYPIFIGSGAYGPGSLRKQIGVQPNGDLTLGGNYNADSIRILAGASGVAYNRFEVSPPPSGFGPSFRARSGTSDINVPMSFDTFGNGTFSFTSNSFGSTVFQIFGSTTGTSWLSVAASAAGTPSLVASGAAANIDISLTPKGTGRVRFGAFTGGADAAITGYVTIKDSNGTERKLAVIA